MTEILAETGEEIFDFNREGWKFGSALRQRELYQCQKMRIKQFDLYRDDIRNLFALTIGKMDKYVIVCVVMLSITMEMYYKGRSPASTPSWVFWCWAICTSGAILYFLMSLWLSIHASISAQTFSVRCLTQWLRLPIPSPEEIMSGATKLENFEVSGSVLRVPVLATNPHSGPSIVIPRKGDSMTDWQSFSDHFHLFNHLHRNWQGHEAYSRVCMCMGMNHFLSAMTYFSLAFYAIEFGTPWSGWAFGVIFQFASVLHVRLNLNLSKKEAYVMIALLIIPPGLMCIAVAIVLSYPATSLASAKVEFVPCIFACVAIIGHIGWVVFFLIQTAGDINGLPGKFSSVWCIDVLGFGVETLNDDPATGNGTPSKFPSYSTGGGPGGCGGSLASPKSDAGTEELAHMHETEHERQQIKARIQLPWLVFKIASYCMAIMWGLALVETILVVSRADTGTTVPARRLESMESSVNHLSIKNNFAVRGFIGNTIFADEFNLISLSYGLSVTCPIGDNRIKGLSGSPTRPVVFTRSSNVIDCHSGTSLLLAPNDTASIAVKYLPSVSSYDIFAIRAGNLWYYTFDSSEPHWLQVSDGKQYSKSAQLSFSDYHSDIVYVLNNQTIHVWNVLEKKITQTIAPPQQNMYLWTHISGQTLIGLEKMSYKQVVTTL